MAIKTIQNASGQIQCSSTHGGSLEPNGPGIQSSSPAK